MKHEGGACSSTFRTPSGYATAVFLVLKLPFPHLLVTNMLARATALKLNWLDTITGQYRKYCPAQNKKFTLLGNMAMYIHIRGLNIFLQPARAHNRRRNAYVYLGGGYSYCNTMATCMLALYIFPMKWSPLSFVFTNQLATCITSITSVLLY